MIRPHTLASWRSKAKPKPEAPMMGRPLTLRPEGLPDKGRKEGMRWLMTGRSEDAVRGLGIPDGMSGGLKAAPSGDRGAIVPVKEVKASGGKGSRKSDPEVSEMTKRLVEVPFEAPLTRETDPLWFVKRSVWTPRMLETLRQGGPKGGRWYWLHDKVFKRRILREAFALVAANDGAPGVDGVTVKAFGMRLEWEIDRILEAWQTGRFRPQTILRKWIPKPGSKEERPLGIPTVRDRVVQTALRMVLEPIFEMDFHPNSFGFRPGRKAQEAIAKVLKGLNAGKVWVVDADLKSYFDRIPHDRLLEAIKGRITDRRILALIEQYLKAGIMDKGVITEPGTGSPQGGVISPLLANLYLNALDHLMAKAGWYMIRYADDFVILCETQEEAQRALEVVQEWTREAGLTLHPDKTRLVDLGVHRNSIDFLGFRIQRHEDRKTGRGRFLRLVRPKSLAKLTEKIRGETCRTSGRSLSEIIRRLNRSLSGWFRYFRSAHESIHKRIDQTIHRRLRAILAKRRGCPNWGGGRGHTCWPNSFFAGQGLFSLKEAHVQYIQSCGGTR